MRFVRGFLQIVGALTIATLCLAIFGLMIEEEETDQIKSEITTPNKPQPVEVATEKKPVGVAHPYTIVDKEIHKKHAINRTKVSASIRAPGAKTFNDRVATLVKAAGDLHRMTNGTSISLVLWDEANNHHGYPFVLGRALYIPDGRGISGQEPPGQKWEAHVSDIQLSDQDIRIMEAWFQHRDRFKDQFGLTDEDRLIPHIATLLKLSQDEIKLPRSRERRVNQTLLASR